ncbi:MAG: hypothetical protein ACOY31_02240 [Bacillota bacterium]
MLLPFAAVFIVIINASFVNLDNLRWGSQTKGFKCLICLTLKLGSTKVAIITYV